MTEREAFYSVDRLERAVAVLVGDDGVGLDVLKKTLPVKVREGVVLRVRLDAAGNPDWSSAAIDDAERERRLQEARECLERLRGTDPGGDEIGRASCRERAWMAGAATPVRLAGETSAAVLRGRG